MKKSDRLAPLLKLEQNREQEKELDTKVSNIYLELLSYEQKRLILTSEGIRIEAILLHCVIRITLKYNLF